MGRENNKVSASYFQIGESNTISKKHARVFWDCAEKAWKIENISKNKIYVNFDQLLSTEAPRIIENMSFVLISKVKMFFLLPRDD